MTPSRDIGMTLIELVVAMAIFALVAVMGLQALSGTIRGQERAAIQDANHAALARGIAVLRQDLNAILPMLFFPPGTPEPQSAVQALPNGGGMAMSRGAVPRLNQPAEPDRAARAVWIVDRSTDTLSRSVWPTLTPANLAQQSEPLAILENIERVELRSFWVGIGWTPGAQPPFPQVPASGGPPDGDNALGTVAPEVYSDLLPQAIEVTLITRDHGPIVLLESLQ